MEEINNGVSVGITESIFAENGTLDNYYYAYSMKLSIENISSSRHAYSVTS
jgi:hypothetical protein